MLVVHVHVSVKAGQEDAFVAATRINAAASLREPGVVRFDLVRDLADPTHFVLVEVYRDEQAPAAHKETEHYKTWRDTVESMMAEPRRSTKFVDLFPEGEGAWRSPG